MIIRPSDATTHPAVGLPAGVRFVTSILKPLPPVAHPRAASNTPLSEFPSGRAAWPGVAAYAVLVVLWTWFGSRAFGARASSIDALLFLPLNLTAIYWYFRGSANPALQREERSGFHWLGLAFTCTLIGNAIWSLGILDIADEPRYAWSNLFYLGAYLLGTVGISRFPIAPRGRAEVRKFLLDLACVVVAMAAIIWTLLVAPITLQFAWGPRAVINIVYPVFAVLQLAMLSRLIMRQPANSSYSTEVVLLAVALFAQCTIDLVLELDFRTSAGGMSFWSGTIYPALYVLVVFSTEQAARRSSPAAAPRVVDPSLNPTNLLPILAALSVYAFLVWAALTDRREPLATLVGAAVILNVLFLLKQAIAVRENAALIAERAEAASRAAYEERAREGQKLEAVGRLAGGVAHDFNNLLTTVLVNTEFALTKLKPHDAGFEEMRDIRGAAERGAALIRQLLAFSRKSVIAPVTLNLATVLTEMERLLERLASDRCRLLLALPPDLGQVRVDRGQLEQVLANLVTNARDAMPDGGAIVIAGANVTLDSAAAAALEVPPGAYVTISVLDSGVGIAPEARGRIFEPFFSTKARGKGTGLGLASCYGIMRQSDGAIDVASEPGAGARFTLYLPRVASPADVTTTGVQPPAHSAARGETILLVEDELAVRQITSRMLRAEGYTVLTAADAVGARAMFAQHGESIALMITDVMMPGDTGIQLAESVRERWPHAAIVFISGYADTELAEISTFGPTDYFVQKPFTGQQLVTHVQRALEHRRSPAPIAARSQ